MTESRQNSEEGSVFLYLFPILSSHFLCSSYFSSLTVSFLSNPSLDFSAIFFHFLYVLAHSSDTLLREIYFVKDSARQIQRNEPLIVKLFS